MVPDDPSPASRVAQAVSIRFEVRGGSRRSSKLSGRVKGGFQSALRFAVVPDEEGASALLRGRGVSIRFEVRGGSRQDEFDPAAYDAINGVSIRFEVRGGSRRSVT